MATLRGGTKAMATNWIVEVFDWESAYPSGGSSQNESSFAVMGGLMKGLKDAVPDSKQYAYLDRDVLRSFTSKSANEAFSLTAITKVKSDKGYKNVGDIQALYGDGTNVSNGIIGVSFNRSKGSIEGKCNLSVAGPLPSHTRAGNWVLVSSVRVDPEKGPLLMPAFIGQIQQIDSEYAMSEAGAQTARHSVTVNEWSNFLTTPIFFDLRTGAKQEQSATRLTKMLEDVASASTSEVTKLQEITKKNLNPYTGAKMLLQMIGLLNQQTYEGYSGTPIYKLTTAMPAVPDKLLRRLGYPDSVKSTNAFAEGFVKIVSGRQKKKMPELTSGWDGMFAAASTGSADGYMDASEYLDTGDGSDAEKPTIDIDQYVDSFEDFADDKDNQPYSLNFGAVAQVGQGMSVWDSLSTHCDPSLNEFFTDIYYSYDSESGSVLARPVLVVRGKCFKTKAAEDACFNQSTAVAAVPEKPESGNAFLKEGSSPSSSLKLPFSVEKLSDMGKNIVGSLAGDFSGGTDNPPYKTWSYYEDLPRIQVDAALITNLRLTNSGVMSPNLFTMGVENVPSVTLSSSMSRFASMYTKRHDAEVARFGSITRRITTSFLFTAEGSAASRWFTMVGDLVRVWEGYTYRTAIGVMRIKNPGLALSVGMNIEFSLPNRMTTNNESGRSVGGYTTYVAHIDSISTNFQMSGSGQRITHTDIQFSRLMQIMPDGSGLEFCPPSTWGNLWYTKVAGSSLSADNKKKGSLPIA